MSSFPRQPAAEQRPASFQEFIGLERWTDADGWRGCAWGIARN